MISADAITSRTFTTVRFKEGYSAREVDDFLDEIVDRMATDDHSLARRIKEKTFSNVRFREGYDIDEVDDFLDEVARGLEGEVLIPHRQSAIFRMVLSATQTGRCCYPFFVQGSSGGGFWFWHQSRPFSPCCLYQTQHTLAPQS